MGLERPMNQVHRVIRLEVSGGVPSVRDSLSWRLATSIPHCSLVASSATGSYELLVSENGTDASVVVRERVDRMVARLNEFHPSEVPLDIRVTADDTVQPAQRLASA